MKKFNNFLKENSEEITDSKISKLFEELKFHDLEHQRIDEQLANICKDKISHLMKNQEFEKAKKEVYNFYKNYDDFTFEKDLILVKINRGLRIQKDSDKYNI